MQRKAAEWTVYCISIWPEHNKPLGNLKQIPNSQACKVLDASFWIPSTLTCVPSELTATNMALATIIKTLLNRNQIIKNKRQKRKAKKKKFQVHLRLHHERGWEEEFGQ